MIDSEICIRYEKEVEDWDHIWTCETNEFTIREVILGAIVSYEEQLLKAGDVDQAAMVRNINIAFTNILFEQPSILVGKGNY